MADNSKIGIFPGTTSSRLKENSVPKQLPPHKIPFAISDEVKTEIDRLVELNVLIPVNEPTECVNQMAVARRKSGDLRVCIDPRHLNKVLIRERYPLPTIEDVMVKISEAKVFSRFDVASAYWHVELDSPSSFLTTMITPW